MPAKVTKTDYDRLVPRSSFIGRHMEYMSRIETPYAFDFWTAMWLMSVALGRFTFVDRPRTPVFLNWFVMLVSDSGVTRKSTAVREATRLANMFASRVLDLDDEMQISKNQIMLVQSKMSPEELEYLLHRSTIDYGYAHVAISISELLTFLGRERYTLGMPGLLTDLYDCPEFRGGGGTVSRGRSIIRNVYVCFLSATTPTWLIRTVNPDVVEGGFTSRVVFVAEEHPKKPIAWPEGFANDEERVEQTVREMVKLRERTQQHPKIPISKAAKEHFVHWYNTRILHTDPFRATYESREDDHVLRCAACLAINRQDEWKIETNDIALAIQLVEEVKDSGTLIFRGGASTSGLIIGLDSLREMLLLAGRSGVKQSALTRSLRTHMDAQSLRDALAIMHEMGLVQKFEAAPLKGRPAILWRGTNSLLNIGALEAVAHQMKPTIVQE